jgi:stearoyl-CoA desaturase (delta-9 desaturase)
VTEFVALFLLFYLWHALGVTVGYHRLVSHRSFACPKWVEYFFVSGGYLAFEGSPIWWATIHRAHHRYADTALDPHSPRNGIREAHYGWITHRGYPDHIDPHKQAKDLVKDPVYSLLDRNGSWHESHWTALAICLGFRLLIWACFGWVAALASLAAGVAVQQIPLMLNVVCHLPKFGYKTYSVTDDSVNVWWVAILAMGEGWHNNHHASPGSAKTGMRPWEFDVSWLTISLMKRLRLAWRVNEYTHEELMLKSLAQLHKQRLAQLRSTKRSLTARGASKAVEDLEELDIAI